MTVYTPKVIEKTVFLEGGWRIHLSIDRQKDPMQFGVRTSINGETIDENRALGWAAPTVVFPHEALMVWLEKANVPDPVIARHTYCIRVGCEEVVLTMLEAAQ